MRAQAVRLALTLSMALITLASRSLAAKSIDGPSDTQIASRNQPRNQPRIVIISGGSPCRDSDLDLVVQFRTASDGVKTIAKSTHGWEVEVLPNPTKDVILSYLNSLAESPLWLIYLGHGIVSSEDRQSLLCLPEGDRLSVDTLVRAIPATLPFASLLIDACDSADVDVSDAPGEISIISASPGRVDTEWPEGSVLTHELRALLVSPPDTNHDGVVTDREIFDALNLKVSETKATYDHKRRNPPAPKLQTQTSVDLPLLLLPRSGHAFDGRSTSKFKSAPEAWVKHALPRVPTRVKIDRDRRRYVGRVPPSEAEHMRQLGCHHKPCTKDIGQCFVCGPQAAMPAQMASNPSPLVLDKTAPLVDGAEAIRRLQERLKTFADCRKELPDIATQLSTLPIFPEDSELSVIVDSLRRRIDFIRCRCSTAELADCTSKDNLDRLWSRYSELKKRLRTSSTDLGSGVSLRVAREHEEFETALELFRRLGRNTKRWLEVRADLRGLAMAVTPKDELVPEVLERWRRGEITSRELDEIAKDIEARRKLKLSAPQNTKILLGIINGLANPELTPLRKAVEALGDGLPAPSQLDAIDAALDGLKHAVLLDIHRKMTTATGYRPVPIRSHELLMGVVPPPGESGELTYFIDEFVELVALSDVHEDGYTERRQLKDLTEEQAWLDSAKSILTGQQGGDAACQGPLKACRYPFAGVVALRFLGPVDGVWNPVVEWHVKREGKAIESGSWSGDGIPASRTPEASVAQRAAAFHATHEVSKQLSLLKQVDLLFTDLVPSRQPPPESRRPRLTLVPFALVNAGLPLLLDTSPRNDGYGIALATADTLALGTIAFTLWQARERREEFERGQLSSLQPSDRMYGYAVAAALTYVGVKLVGLVAGFAMQRNSE